MLSRLSQSVVAVAKGAPPLSEDANWLEAGCVTDCASVQPPPAYRCTLPLPPAGANSEASRPTLRIRHSSGSAPPVVIAMRGMSPSLWLRGNRNTLGSVIAVSEHAPTLGRIT